MKQPKYSRPYATRYYTDIADREPAFSSHGAAKSDRGAIRAAVVRIFMEEFKKALIFDRYTGNLLYTIRLDSGGLRVHYGRAVMEEKPLLQRVK